MMMAYLIKGIIEEIVFKVKLAVNFSAIGHKADLAAFEASWLMEGV